MSTYLRPKVSGACVFFTVCLANRGSDLLVWEIAHLRRAVRETKTRHPFQILAWVTLPDHIHCVWQMPDGDRGYGVRWGSIKSKFSRLVLRDNGWSKTGLVGCNPTLQPDRRVGFQPTVHPPRSNSKRVKGDAGIWQRRFWEHHIRDDRDLENHIRYCWSNPVKHGLVNHPTDWPYSSIHRDIELGGVEPEWAGTPTDIQAGEP